MARFATSLKPTYNFGLQSLLEVLIDAAYEEFQVERLCEDLKCPHCNKPG